jgi:hypothetical protein
MGGMKNGEHLPEDWSRDAAQTIYINILRDFQKIFIRAGESLPR